MLRTNLLVALFFLFAISISIPSNISAEYLEEIKDDPVQSLFSEAVLQSHLSEKVCLLHLSFSMISYIKSMTDTKSKLTLRISNYNFRQLHGGYKKRKLNETSAKVPAQSIPKERELM